MRAPAASLMSLGPRAATTAGAVPAVASPRLVARLRGPDRPATVLHRGRQAVYVQADGWCIGVLAASATQVPCGLATAFSDLAPFADARSAHITRGELWLDDTVVRVGRLRDFTVPALVDPPSWSSGVLMAAGAPASRELGDLRDAPLLDLLGRGSGLTPLADDVLCGWLALGRALGDPEEPVDARGRTTLLSATLLECAASGEVIPQFGELLRALSRHDEDATRTAAARLAQVGHTSGAGLLLGAGLRLETDRRAEHT